jgi:DNA-binding GntR family transcriptional regulator
MTDQVYELLKDEIMRVERRPGDLVLESELASKYGVSKTPVREALRLLARDGWVIVLPRKGYLIRPLRLEDVREIFALRGIVEPEAASQAARTAIELDVLQLRALIAEQSEAVDDLGAALGAARKFHVAGVDMAGNTRLSRVLVDLLDEVRRLHFLLPNVESHITSREELGAHQRLVKALAAGDAEKSADIMRKHIAEVARTLVRGFGGV